MSMDQETFRRCVREDVEDRYRRLCCRVQTYLHRYGHRLLHGDGGVAVEEVRRTLGLHDGNTTELATLLALPAPEVIADELDRVEASIAERRRCCLQAGRELPFDALVGAFGLSTVELDLLTVQLAAQTNPSLQRLLRMAWADFTTTRATVGFVAELLGDDDDGLERVVWSLGENAPLLAYRLIELVEPEGTGGPVPLLQRGLVIPDRVVGFLLFGEAGAAALGSDAPWTLDPPPTGDTDPTADPQLTLPATVRESVEAALSGLPRSGERPARVLLTGAPGSGRRSLVRQLAHSEGRSLLIVDLARALDSGPESRGSGAPGQRHLAEALREAVLHRALLLIRHAERLGDEGTGEVVRLLNGHNDRLVLTAEESAAGLRQSLTGLVEIAVPALSSGQQESLWTAALQGQLPEPIVASVAGLLARQYSLTPAVIRDTIERARSQVRARPRGPGRRLSAADVLTAARQRVDHKLGHLAQVLTTQLSWDALVVPRRLLENLQDVLARMRNRERVLDEWGFRRQLGRGRGLSCLFYGPPGTGKTLTAELIAKELGREVYRVDLSRVVNKYIGETEKNLGRLFDEAERAQAVLLFDEADSLFGKRTKVKSSHDRYANLEVNYLLQRLETFEGMSILTTNFEAALDEAFKRRLTFRLHFPMPQARERTQLWKRMLPEQARRDADIDWTLLGDRFELPGGHIKNAVLRAAYAAAEQGTPITLEHLYRAGTQECAEMGRLVRDESLELVQALHRQRNSAAAVAANDNGTPQQQACVA